jgi:membrane-associated protease RseP (regulator of RpoE activity)
VFSIQAVHEVAHRVVAKWRKVELGLPVPLPSPEVGTFGATTPFKTFPADQETVFDVAVSGPLSGMVASIGCLVAGTFATLNAPLELLATFPTVPVAFFKGSFLTGSILSTLAPKLMLLPTAQPIPVHPALCIGFAGLLTNALNMLPILGLDGGNALSAIVGRSRAFLASAGTIFTLSLSFLQNDSSTSLFASFGIIYAISRMGRKPLLVRDEISPVSEVRISIYLGAFILALLALTPYPGGQGVM